MWFSARVSKGILFCGNQFLLTCYLGCGQKYMTFISRYSSWPSPASCTVTCWPSDGSRAKSRTVPQSPLILTPKLEQNKTTHIGSRTGMSTLQHAAAAIQRMDMLPVRPQVCWTFWNNWRSGVSDMMFGAQKNCGTAAAKPPAFTQLCLWFVQKSI